MGFKYRVSKKAVCFFGAISFYSATIVTLSPAQGRNEYWGLTGSNRFGVLKYGTDRIMSEKEVYEVFRQRLTGPMPMGKDQMAQRLARQLIRLAGKHRFKPTFLLSVIQAESNFAVDAHSTAGARGLMQLMPGSARYISKRWAIQGYRGFWSLYHPETNLELGVTYLAYLRDRYDGDPVAFLTAYNAGPTLVDRILKANQSLRSIRESDRYIRDIAQNVSKILNGSQI